MWSHLRPCAQRPGKHWGDWDQDGGKAGRGAAPPSPNHIPGQQPARSSPHLHLLLHLPSPTPPRQLPISSAPPPALRLPFIQPSIHQTFTQSWLLWAWCPAAEVEGGRERGRGRREREDEGGEEEEEQSLKALTSVLERAHAQTQKICWLPPCSVPNTSLCLD